MQSSEQQHRCRESWRPLATHPALYKYPGAQTSGKQHWEGMRHSNQGPDGTDQLELSYVSRSLHRCIGYWREFWPLVSVADPGGFLGFHGTPLFVVLRACVAGLAWAQSKTFWTAEPPPPFKILDLPLSLSLTSWYINEKALFTNHYSYNAFLASGASSSIFANHVVEHHSRCSARRIENTPPLRYTVSMHQKWCVWMCWSMLPQ